ncbi:MAG: ABC transporter permease [Actinobacteria bacterium]|nr:ABC transporter permease [Actinomycetota bacterium]
MGERLDRAARLIEQSAVQNSATGGRASGPFHPLRAVNRKFHGRRRLGVGSLLGVPLGWMLFVYVGSLLLLVLSSLYRLHPKQSKPTGEITASNLVSAFKFWDPDVWPIVWVFFRTTGVALLVTAICFLIALPVAFFVSKVAPRWLRRGLIVALLMPLWAGYLVKGYAWRAMVSPAGGRFAAAGRGDGGFLESVFGWTPGFGRAAIVIALVYLWLPYMILPIYAGLDRLPPSLLDAASDLGAKPFRTFRSVILPMLLPSVAAGSIFTFSLTLGDYIVPQIVNNGEERFMFGTIINATLGAPNQPLAAAYTLWPLIIIILYLLAMKRAGAFDNL